MPDFFDFISLQALVAAGGWGLTSAMAIHGLHLAGPHKLRAALYSGVCTIVFILALWLGALQHRDSRIQSNMLASIDSQISEIGHKINSSPGSSTDQILTEIQNRLGPEYPLTKDEASRLSKVIASIPQNERFDIDIRWPALGGKPLFAQKVAKIFIDQGWNAVVQPAGLLSANGIDFATSEDVAARKKAIPIGMTKITKILTLAGIKYTVVGLKNIADDEFAFVVGNPTQ